MPDVILPIGENNKVVALPPICIRCGAPATRKIKMEFKPKEDDDTSISTSVPVCNGHPFMGHFQWIILGGLAVIVLLSLPAMLLKPWVHHYIFAAPLIALVGMICLFAPLALFSSIGCKHLDEDGLTISGASPKFISALGKQSWTHEKTNSALRKNRNGEDNPNAPYWTSPFVYCPTAMVLSFLLFSPIGYLLARNEKSGPWPAGSQAANPQQGQVAVVPPANNAPAVPINDPAPNNPPVINPINNEPLQAVKQPESLNPLSIKGLVGYWSLDEVQGGGAQDSSGHGILALLNGGQWVKGVSGGALTLNGTSDFLDLGPADNRLSFGAGAPFTISCWVATTTDTGVISSWRRRGNLKPVVDLLIKDGKARGWVRDDNSNKDGANPVGSPINDGKWHHVALVRKNDGTVEIHVDGKLQGSDKGKNSVGPITTDLHTVGLERFVQETNQKGPTHFAGSIDEFSVFDRALGVEELALLAGLKL